MGMPLRDDTIPVWVVAGILEAVNRDARTGRDCGSCRGNPGNGRLIGDDKVRVTVWGKGGGPRR